MRLSLPKYLVTKLNSLPTVDHINGHVLYTESTVGALDSAPIPIYKLDPYSITLIKHTDIKIHDGHTHRSQYTLQLCTEPARKRRWREVVG